MLDPSQRRQRTRFSWPAVLLAVALGGAPAPSLAADDTESTTHLGEAFKQGEFGLALRYRFENVDQDGFDKEAHASTLRTALSYAMKPFYGFSAAVTFENVTSVGNDLYDNNGAGSLNNGVSDRPVVADPEITEVNEAYLQYSGWRDTTIKAGRSQYVLDNERFVGAVGWRQNWQSFDGGFFDSEIVENWHFHYGYVDRQHFVNGADWGMATHLVNVAWDSPIGTVGGYGYLIEYDDESRAKFSGQTFGVRLDGTRETGSLDLLYYLEYATQSDSGNNPVGYDVDYVHAELGVRGGGLSGRVGYELLSGTGEAAFQTPLGTNHKFNGFADKFLTTPDGGLEDLYLQVNWSAGRIATFATYHFFASDTGGLDYGEELDAQFVYTTKWKQQFAAKAALYSAEDFATDTSKYWVWTSWGF